MVMSMGGESTIRDYISTYKTEDVVISAFFLQQVFNSKNGKLLVNFQNLVIKYMPELKSMLTKIELENEDYLKYRYNPKLLSYDLYGTTELWFMILEANELRSATEFDLRTIKVFSADVVDKLVRVMNLEVPSKDYNAEEVSADLIG